MKTEKIVHVCICLCSLLVLVIYYFNGLHPELFKQYAADEQAFLAFSHTRTILLVFGLGVVLHLSNFITKK